MADPPPTPPSAPVTQTVEQLSRLYEEHNRAASTLQRVANRVTATIARPVSLFVIGGLVAGWIGGNVAAGLSPMGAFERFPFPDLAFIATVAALLVALLILTTQRHEDELAEKRARLTLQIAALSEKKIAKIIELLEEQRRDNPLLPMREDALAADMAQPIEDMGELADDATATTRQVPTAREGAGPVPDT